jgi:hypothetical protein
LASVPIGTTGSPPSDVGPQTLIIQADPTTGFACLISYSPQGKPPDPGAIVLLKNWRP